MSIIKKIESACLIGRGGAGFPTHIKLQAVAKSKSKVRYLVINGAEGEPGIYKDGYIIKNHLKEFSQGVKIASDFIKAKKIYFYLNSKYYKLYNSAIIKEFNKAGLKGQFEIFKKPKEAGYIGGEESTILNIIEGQHLEPRLRPPFPTEKGLFGEPTLINNIETIYNIYLVSINKFSHQRFYSINLASKNIGVYSLPDDWSIAKVLRETGNYPDYKFFVQVGGDASGDVLNEKQLEQKVSGAGSITIYDLEKHQSLELIKYWLSFFVGHSCGQCAPCREGTYRLLELFEDISSSSKCQKDCLLKANKDFLDICENLSLSSFCALGVSAPIAVLSYFKNVFPLKVS
ncbi:MAG: NADH-ubiquinone oxidoreductase-F iron-sulfur binding region domain-containing protein [Patescibacteria group bacterium]|nr:NADH-ubiquinone oxidoreductase-F iron-sulfur binding region domain-containing protein [Patescibacteria group bacterium]